MTVWPLTSRRLDVSAAAASGASRDGSCLLNYIEHKSSTAGEEHSGEPHLQDRQGPSRAGLQPEALQPGGLFGAVPEVQTVSLQLASFLPLLDLPAAPTPRAAAADGFQPGATDVLLHTLLELSKFHWKKKYWMPSCTISCLKCNLKSLCLFVRILFFFFCYDRTKMFFLTKWCILTTCDLSMKLTRRNKICPKNKSSERQVM